MNKFLPLTIALLIHILPLSYFMLQKKNFDAPKSEIPSSRPQGIDLSGFSTHRPAKSATAIGAKPKSEQTLATPALEGREGPVSSSSGTASGTSSVKPSEESMILSSVEPIYPPLARQKGLEGKVKLRAHYNSDGNIIEVNIVESSGTKLLDESAKKAFLNWKLKPGSNGSFEKTFQFKLN